MIYCHSALLSYTKYLHRFFPSPGVQIKEEAALRKALREAAALEKVAKEQAETKKGPEDIAKEVAEAKVSIRICYHWCNNKNITLTNNSQFSLIMPDPRRAKESGRKGSCGRRRESCPISEKSRD